MRIVPGSKDGAFPAPIGPAVIAAAFIPGMQAPSWEKVSASGVLETTGLSLALSEIAAAPSPQPALELEQAAPRKPNSGFPPKSRHLQSGVPTPIVYGHAILPGTAPFQPGSPHRT